MKSVAAGGYVAGSLYHWSDFLNLPIPVAGLAWVIALHFMPPAVPQDALFWVTYALLVYQLVSIHDFNACFLDECHTSRAFVYLGVASTCVLWLSMGVKHINNEIISKKKLPKVEPPENMFPALKIQVRPKVKQTQPLRLNMGPSLQPKWV